MDLVQSTPAVEFHEHDVSMARDTCQKRRGTPCDACIKILGLESEISAAHDPLESLLRQHRELKTALNRVHDPFILQLPLEIASAIFRLCFPTYPCAADFRLPVGFQFMVTERLILGKVCREWRQIAWSTHCLWTGLPVKLHSSLPWQSEFIREWLGRAGSLPLAVLVYGNWAPNMEFSYEYGKGVINVLNEYCHRWRIVGLMSLPPPFYSQFKGNSTCLRSLQVHGPSWINLNGHPSRLIFQNDALPLPEFVILRGLALSMAAINWQNVTILEVGELQDPEYILLLENAPKLLRLVLNLPYSQTPAPLSKTVVYPQLRELQINGCRTPHVWYILDHIILPGLKTFGLSTLDAEPPCFDKCLAWLERSGCHLESLTFIAPDYSSSDIVDFLAHRVFRWLEDLELALPPRSDCLPDELFRRLGDTAILHPDNDKPDSETDPPFLPKLSWLICLAGLKYNVVDNPPAFPWALLARIFGPLSELQNPCRRPLRIVEIKLAAEEEFEDNVYSDKPIEIDRDCIPALKDVLRAGLKLEVMCECYDGCVDVMSTLLREVHEESGSDLSAG